MESSTAMWMPPMPRMAEGIVRNWSPLATGIVRMAMSCAPRAEGLDVPSTASNSATGRTLGALVEYLAIVEASWFVGRVITRRTTGKSPV